MTDARRTVLAAAGSTAVVTALVAALGVRVPGVTDAVSGLDATLATGVLGVVLVGYGLRQRRHGRRSEDRSLTEQSREDASDGRGDRFDRALTWAARDASDSVTREARETVRVRVRSTAVRAYARRRSVCEDEASEAVRAGEWTDDVVAAAFLGDERAPRYPLRERLRGWVRPDRAFRRRAERATDAVHDLATEGRR